MGTITKLFKGDILVRFSINLILRQTSKIFLPFPVSVCLLQLVFAQSPLESLLASAHERRLIHPALTVVLARVGVTLVATALAETT